MKKLMIAAAIVCATAMSQAATVQWEAADIYTFNGPTGESETYATDYLVYYIDAGDYSYANAQEALGKGDISFVKTYGELGTYDGPGAIVADTSDRYNPLDAVSAYAVVLNTNKSIDDATYAFLSTSDSGEIGEQGQSPYLTFDTSDTGSGSNWSAVAVPEPTSGLLLLLGVAGLALRRRRA